MPVRTSHCGGKRLQLRSAVAILVTGIIILSGLALFHRLHAPSAGSPSVTHGLTPPAYSTANVPVTPVATPGPQSKYVYDIMTGVVLPGYGGGYEISHFPAGSVVDVVMLVRGIPKGQKHTISIHWYFDGQELSAHASQEIESSQAVLFAMQYPKPGLGMARIFFDLPSNDSGTQANDLYLAGQIYFAIDPAPPATPTPAG
jgi:hypothetical protein